jgi:hypothetical protein
MLSLRKFVRSLSRTIQIPQTEGAFKMSRFVKTAASIGLAVALTALMGLAAKGAKPGDKSSGKTYPIPAVIDFVPAQGSVNTPGLTGDGGGSYLDGEQNVSAFFFSGTRNAGLYTQADSNLTAIRHLFLDLFSPIQTLGSGPFAGTSTETSGNITAQINQNMLDDVSGQLTCCSANGLMTIQYGDPARYGAVSLFFPDPQDRNLQWKMVWGPATGSCLETSVNSTNDIWQVNTGSGSSVEGCAGQSGHPNGPDVAALYSASTTTRKVTWSAPDYYHVPFQFTIKAK